MEISKRRIEQEINELKQQLQTRKEELEYQEQYNEVNELKQKLRFLENEYQNNLNAIKDREKQSNDYQSTQQIELLKSLSEKFQQQEAELSALRKSQMDQERKILEQEKQIIELEKTATLNFSSINDDINEIEMNINGKNQIGNALDEDLYIPSGKSSSKESHFIEWEKRFGDKLVALDYANQMMIKPEFGKNVEGGWGFDNYSSLEEGTEFISSLKSISERAGKQSFTINGKGYKVVRNGNEWSIEEKVDGDYSVYSKQAIDNDVKKLAPTDVKKFNGVYESYSSLLINLNHFPVDYLDKFEEFLMSMVSDLPIYKDKYIYMNKRAYESGNSNITSYARVYFKHSSTQEEVEILMASLALKNALIKFVNNYRSKNNHYVVSFSMVLTNHKREIKFIQAQTNYDILRTNPVPFKIPMYKIILDSEFNSLLKYHENELWKKIKPFALDYQGHTYYVCDVDVEDYKKYIS